MKGWQNLGTNLGVILTIILIAGAVWAAFTNFETKADHKDDLTKQEKYLEVYIESAANRAAQATMDKWMSTPRGRR